MKKTVRTCCALLVLAMVLGLLPGMGSTAYADNTETLLTTITATGQEQANYSTANVATVSFSYTSGGSSAYLANWGWWGYGWTATVNAAEGYTITKCVFYDDANRTATDSSSPFVVETTEEDKTPRINGTPIDGGNSWSKGLKKIEVYGYATPASSYSVTITAGDHMTKTAGSGEAQQTGLSGAMADVVYTANDGYYFPENYSVAAVNGISVTRNSSTQITVSGTPTADATITLTAPTALTWDGNFYADLVPTGSEEAAALTAKQVTFNGKKWYVIKDESTAENAGTLTLLYAGSLGNLAFDDSGSNEYANSSIKAKLGNLTAEKGYYYSVAEAIKDTENGKLYLLSEEEANQVPLNVRKDFPSDAWWLSTARDGGKVAYVYVTSPNTPGMISNKGIEPTSTAVCVRPALQLDLSKVVYDSETKTFAIPATAPTISSVTGATLVAGYGAGSVSVTATAADGHTLSYQWYQSTANSNEGGEKIDGATSATYNVPTGKEAGTYYYYCVVTATRTDNSQTASAASGVAVVTVAADTDALVAKLAEEKNIDLSQYYLIPAEDMYFTSKEYWIKGSAWERISADEYRVGTKQFTKEKLPADSLIFCKAYYAFEAVAWDSSRSTTGNSAETGKRYNLLIKISDQFADLWDTYSFFGFNLTKYAEGDFNTKEEADLPSISDAFRIYVPKGEAVAMIDDVSYYTLADAVRAARAGDTIKLLRDAKDNLVVTSGKAIKLDLNGHKLTNDGRHCTIVVQKDSKLVVTENGTVDNTTHGCAPLYNNGGTVTLNGGTFIRSEEAGIDGDNTYYTVVNRGTMTINEGVTIENDTANYSSLIANGYNELTKTGYREIDPKVSNGYVKGESAANPTLTINGGTFKGGNQALKNDVNGIATVNGGNFSSSTGNAVKNLNELTISGGTFTAEAEGKFALHSAADGTATVTGGTFIGKLQKDEGATIAISGGEFSEPVSEDFCAQGYAPATATNASGKYIVLLNSTVTTAPEANTLSFNGQPRELVTAGVAEGGQMQYALGTQTGAAGDYGAAIPTATDAGTYYVWYKVVGDSDHNDTEPAVIPVTLAKGTPTISAAPTASDIILGQALNTSTLTGGTASVPGAFAWKDGTVVPALTDSQITAYAVVFTPEDTANYEGVETTVTLTVIDPDQVAADGVADTLNALPAEPALTDMQSVKDARAAYEALTPEQKDKVDSDALQKLADAEQAVFTLYAQKKAENLSKQLNQYDTQEIGEKVDGYVQQLNTLTYDETKTLDENLAAADEISQEGTATLNNYRASNYVVLGVKTTLVSPIEGVKYEWQHIRPGQSKWYKATGKYKLREYTFTPKKNNEGYIYTCKVTLADGSVVYTDEIHIHVLAIEPTVVESPEAETNAISGSKVTLHAEGQDYASFRWQVRKPGASKWSNVGSRNKDLTVTASAKTNGYQYRCAFINPTGTVYSDVTELVVELVAPVITEQPQDVTAAVKAKATFTVAAEGAQKYVWYYQAPGTDTWKKASGGSRATLKVSVKANMNGYQYRCDISNADGTTTSDIATLTVE